ncbi:DinB superfamily protein [Paenibacillus sp. 1_12]|uniref:DinB family protein n=1 Tax=Paenibacillus sp. 1_12 TaxID=1566278 RepID=UPI0008EB7031|nr:DinB family protein [Paenibacillus sp. 1_12]SFL74074.1 DinB superfamily protein [Paenibacillus sp. 1_12]
MREAFMFDTMDKYRDRLLQLVDKCPVEQRTVVPTGFNNSILWQIGHILTITEGLVFGFAGEATQIPAEYRAFFGPGTKPADWTEDPPTWEAIVEQLKQQPHRIREVFAGRLQTPIKENFAKADNVEEILMNNLLHDNNHAGTISAMLKVLV